MEGYKPQDFSFFHRSEKLVQQHCLSNLQAIVIDTAVCILCQTQFLSKKRNAVPEFRYSRDRLVQCSIGHFLCGGGD